MQTTMPELLDLREASAATRNKIKVGALRAAVREGKLACFRATDSCSARILIEAQELARWVRSLAGRNIVPAPSEVSAAMKSQRRT